MDTGLGFGGAIYGQGTHGKGVMQGFAVPASTSTIKAFGVSEWEAIYATSASTASVYFFGGLIKGGTSFIESTTAMKSYPNFQWAGFETASEQSTVYTSGYIAWDGQLVPDATWTEKVVD